MSWSFGDGIDLYAAAADMLTGYWDSGPNAGLVFDVGRFTGSQCARWPSATNTTLVKSSGVNDAVHHLAVAFKQSAAISGTTLGVALQLQDGTTTQCSIVFKSNGDILLTSGGPAGTVLATYAGAVAVVSTWYHFEFEVVINNTTGSFKVRKNGNSSDDHSTTGINTRGGTANNYANKLQIWMQTTLPSQWVDDLFWRSHASSVAWLGDIRCYTRMPASDASVTWSRISGASNSSNVDDAQQNTLTDYVYSGTVNDADLYDIASIASTPATVIATTARAYMQKSDAGSRTAAVQLKSGGTTVASSTLTLTTSGWQWAWRMDLTDPNTAAAWTPAAVNSATIGTKVIA